MADIRVDITLTEDESEQLHKICREVVLEHDMGYLEQDNGKANIERCLQALVAAAVRTGFLHGCEHIEAVHARESHEAQSAVEKELEQERVWGYDVGWRLCTELHKASTAASPAPPASPACLAPPRSLSAAAVQTEPPIVLDAPVVPGAPLDWAEDAAALPIPSPSPHTPSMPPSPRDFSALSTGSAKPFASLQRRRRSSPRAPSSWSHSCPIPRQRTQSGVYHHYPQKHTTHFHPSFRFAEPSNYFSPPTQLDWDRDPRLRDLSRALTALGWVKR
ncbi:hypothetical protein B0H14DRAFT_3587876 [Mycena olivaceomarginata]|nr:hypothetical protein B0H14DRAFT_3587876 [Mycena olivaceomarginata]